jgi:hypothetical protein
MDEEEEGIVDKGRLGWLALKIIPRSSGCPSL